MSNKITAFGFVMILLSFLVATVGLPDRTYSSMENRYLQQQPEFSWKRLLDGTYMSDFESYLSDQIAGKDTLVSLKNDVDKVLLRQSSNGVYFGKNGQYVKAYEPDEEQYDKNLAFIQKFADTYKAVCPITMLAAPNVQSVQPDVLPDDVTMADAAEDVAKAQSTLSGVTVVNPVAELSEHKDEYLYFKTDHHWTMRGAYYAYKALGDELGWTVDDLDDYDCEVVSQSFYGSLYSKAPLTFSESDYIEAFYNVSGKYRVTYEDESHIDSLFVRSNLYKKDQYTYFLDGNHSYMKIQSNAKNNRKALVFKDSYSHVLLPFLADQYEQMDVVDLRYYRQSVSELIENGGYSDILLLYNMDFLTTDTNFIWMK